MPNTGTSDAGPQGSALPPAAWGIALACVLPELVLLGSDHGLWGTGWWRGVAYEYGAFWTGLLGSWRPNYAAQPLTMFVTYGFLHAGPGHLVANLITLAVLVPLIVPRLGRRGFLIIYGVSQIGGALGYAALDRIAAPMVGASGALFGLAGALLSIEFDRRLRLGQTVRPVVGACLGLAAGNLVIWWTTGGLLAWQTHLGGFVAGWLAALLLPRTDPEPLA